MIYQFHIQLLNVHAPTVWRRVAVPANSSFLRFHKIIQAAFGWKQAHLFQFSPGSWGTKPAIGLKLEDDEPDMIDCKKVKLTGIFSGECMAFTYIYDFGDSWVHAISLEKMIESDGKKAQLLDGGGKCPPEDCGGPFSYMQMKEALSNNRHPDYYETRDWLGLPPRGKWNPEAFDLAKAQAAVQRA